MISSFQPKQKILIVGAGMAGLAAANALKNKGYQVVILEARNRVGGRTFTDHALGVPFDLGASWIHGIEGNIMVDLARKFNANFQETDAYSSICLFDKRKQLVPKEKITAFNNDFLAMLQHVSDMARHADRDMPLTEALTKYGKKKK